MHTVKLVAAFCENRPGLLARLTRVLAEADINIRWMTIATSSTFGVAKFLVNHPDRALEQLRQAGFTASPVEVLAVEVADRPGGLHAVADLLARHGINIENASGFVTQLHRRAVLLIETQALAEAARIVQNAAMHVFTPAELMEL